MSKDNTGKKPTVFQDLSIFRIQKSPKALIELASQEISDASSNEISLNIVDTSGTQAGFNVDLHAKRLEYSKRILVVVHKPDLIYPCSLRGPDPYTKYWGNGKYQSTDAADEDAFLDAFRILAATNQFRSIVASIMSRIGEL